MAHTPDRGADSGASQPAADTQGVTRLLDALSSGRSEAWDELLPIIYGELRGVAHRHLNRERPDHTLGTTALVNEAYLKLAGGSQAQWSNRAHFFAIASGAMRQILIDYAKSRNRDKRGGGAKHVSLDDVIPIAERRSGELLALDEALNRLEQANARQCRVVECRFFSGMSIQDTAAALGVSVNTVKRDWALARAWLNQELGQDL